MRIGVIGVGRIGAFHTSLLKAMEPVGEVVVADVDTERARRVAAELSVQAEESIDTLIDRCDGVVICAATSAHADLILRSVDAGKPTFCEKPIALDLESSQRVVDHVRAKEGVVQMGFQRRFDPGYRAAHELVHSGGIGTLYTVRMVGHDPEPPHESYIPHSGGIFRDFSVHDFDALRFVTGREVEEVYARGAVLEFPLFERYGDVDTAVALLVLQGGAFGLLSVTRHDPLGYDIRMELHGSGDSVAVGWDDRMPLRSLEPGVPPPPGPAYTRFQDRFRAAYQAELGHFLRVVAGEAPVACTVEDALEAMRVAVACDLSRQREATVKVREVTG